MCEDHERTLLKKYEKELRLCEELVAEQKKNLELMKRIHSINKQKRGPTHRSVLVCKWLKKLLLSAELTWLVSEYCDVDIHLVQHVEFPQRIQSLGDFTPLDICFSFHRKLFFVVLVRLGIVSGPIHLLYRAHSSLADSDAILFVPLPDVMCAIVLEDYDSLITYQGGDIQALWRYDLQDYRRDFARTKTLLSSSFVRPLTRLCVMNDRFYGLCPNRREWNSFDKSTGDRIDAFTFSGGPDSVMMDLLYREADGVFYVILENDSHIYVHDQQGRYVRHWDVWHILSKIRTYSLCAPHLTWSQKPKSGLVNYVALRLVEGRFLLVEEMTNTLLWFSEKWEFLDHVTGCVDPIALDNHRHCVRLGLGSYDHLEHKLVVADDFHRRLQVLDVVCYR
jgi:hypothetical protein